MPDLTFPAFIDPEQPNAVCDAFSVTFRDFPECLHFGAGRHTAREAAREVLAEAIARRIATGQTLPSPSAPKPGEIGITITIETDRSAAAPIDELR